jgi:hypothetical protein
LPEPAHGGRSACAGVLPWLELAPLGRLEPNPCGARPRSVVFPCADQLRDPLFAGRLGDVLLFTDARPLNPPLAFADGGRLLERSRCCGDVVPLFPSRPGRLFGEGELPTPLRAPKPPLFPPRFTGPFPARPADSPRVSIVLTGMCEAAAPGDVRATTERLIAEDGGVATRPRAFAAPVKLVRVGVKSARLVTCAPRKDACVTCIDPRLIACPFTNALREAAVTARTLCAYA